MTDTIAPELGHQYRLRNGCVGVIEEQLERGDFFGTVTQPGTPLTVRIIWTKEGASARRGSAWDLIEEVDGPASQPMHEMQEFAEPETPHVLDRIAVALERVADVLERWAADMTPNFDEDDDV